MRIALAYIHPGVVRAEFMDSVCRTLADPEVEFVRIAARSSADITRARNELFRAAVDVEPDFLWWLDTDVCFDEPIVHRLLIDTALSRPEPSIVSALYFGRHYTNGALFPVFSMFDRQGNLRRGTVGDIRARSSKHGPLEVAGVGMGCCMIPSDVLVALSQTEGPLWPYAETQELSPGPPTEDDITFCLRGLRAGFKTFIDPKVKVGHVKDEIIWP